MNELSIPNYPSLLHLNGHGVIVLGAGQGIGEQTAHALAQAGAKVLCVDQDAQLASRIADAVGGVPFAADVTSREDMVRIFEIAKSSFGRVRGVVDIVGVSGIRPLADFDDAAWTKQFDIVLRHAFLAIQIGGEIMAADGGGAFAFVGSMGGDRAVPRQVAYSTAKAALHHLVRCAAVEYAPRGVRINAVAPGYVRTPRLNERLSESAWAAIGRVIPLGRPAMPAEIAGPLLFLMSELSSHISGQVIGIDGGASALAAFPDVPFDAIQAPTP
ncbi:SDR family NAD(P)-dependent oxidoreductase [Burkholderia stagnalis]|uniref:SDR family NAD(P)-dependent oxidoreductase n=1 Tax=Burkholderia stagnalis TaxID=1503054 RepID=UPI0007C6620D|nr:SDR family oxidoreductase [Burkholderia stagnalis]